MTTRDVEKQQPTMLDFQKTTIREADYRVHKVSPVVLILLRLVLMSDSSTTTMNQAKKYGARPDVVRGGKEQRECSHLIVLRYVDDNIQQEQPITPKQQQQEQPITPKQQQQEQPS